MKDMVSLARNVALLVGLGLYVLTPEALAAPATWQVIETPNFRVLHLDSRMGREVARAAERWRQKLDQVWTGGLPTVRWKIRCDLYLFRDNAELVRMTGGSRKAGSALALQSRLMGGKVYRRRINLAANDRELLTSTLPHEVSHVVLKDLVRNVPRWADEGIAMTAESRRSKRRRVLALRRAVHHGPFY
ncbi:MAG: hypothetical protein JRH20_02885, partial [Deltaproteobacteria bacterium]|nr:hypothetical protein [Deltaproteobacteria bacterium]